MKFATEKDHDDLALEDGQKSFLSIVEQKTKYMLKVDPRQSELAEAFRMVSIAGTLSGSIKLHLNGADREVKGFVRLSKYFKTHMYKTAKLQPRVSDPDFLDGMFDDDGDTAVAPNCSATRLMELEVSLQETSALASVILGFVQVLSTCA
jgi:hypothetical protein